MSSVMERNTIIEDVRQISSRRARPDPLNNKQIVASPMSDDFPTPRANPGSDYLNGPLTSTTQTETAKYDELYDISECDSEEVEIRLSSSVKRRVNHRSRKDRFPSLVIPSPREWPTIEKMRSATALSPPIRVDIPSSALKKLEQHSFRVPSSSSAPSLDGSASGDDSASLSSCPPTPDLAQRDDSDDQWDVPMQLDPTSLTLLRQLGSEGEAQVLEPVIEVAPEVEAAAEMAQVGGSPPLTGPMRISTTDLDLSPSPDYDDELSALSVPSPGGFFASLDSVAQHTWSSPERVPSTSVAAEFYDLPFRTGGPVGLATSTAAEFYDLPWQSTPPVEQVVSVSIPSPVDEDDPVTAKKGVFSPTELVSEVDEIDEHYDDAMKVKTAASIDRTALWINSQDAYMKAICDDDETDVTDSFKDIADAVPRTPEQATPESPEDSSPSKKSVRFADAVVDNAKPPMSLEEKRRRISPIHDGTFWEGWRHNKRSQRARDVFQHRQVRAEAEHVKRTSCQKQHLEQLKGNFAVTATDRPVPARPISFLPTATEDEKKEALLQVERERQALEQMSTSAWHVAAQKQVQGGKLITSPIESALHSRQPSRVLDLHGQVHCSWAWNVALEHPSTTVYTMANSDAEAHVIESALDGPENHVVAVAPKAWELPFEDDFFDVVSARNLYAHLRNVWPKGYVADEWDLTLRECLRVLRPGGYLEFQLLDAELIYPDASGQALGVEFAFNLKTRGYDPTAGRSFLPRLKRAGFTDIKRAWMVLPVADVLPRWTDAGKHRLDNSPRSAMTNSPSSRSSEIAPKHVGLGLGASPLAASPELGSKDLMGSTKDVRAITGLVGARMWEQWMLKLNCEMGRNEERCLEGVAKALEDGGQGNAGWKCLVGWARKDL